LRFPFFCLWDCHTVVVIDQVGKVLFFNKAAEEFWGWKPNEVNDVKDLMPFSVAKHHDGYLSAYLQTGKSNVIGKGRVVDIKTKSGKKLSTLLSVTETVTAARHTFTGVFRPAEESTTRGKTDWSSYANLTDGVFVIDEQATVMFANNAVTPLFGYTPRELIGENIRKIMFPEDARLHNGYVTNYLKTGVAKVIGTGRRVVGQTKDDSAKAVHLTVVESKIGSHKAHFIGIMKAASDEVQKTLLQSERDVIESLSFPSIIIDPQGVIQGMNQTALKFFGYRYLEVLARNVNMLMNDDDAKRHDRHLAQFAKTGKGNIMGVGREVLAKKKNGSLFRVNLAVTEKSDGEVTLYVGVFSVIKT
jgi:PAS domain S-box-containing protein